MAQVQVLVSDRSGKQMQPGEGETMAFEFDGTRYEIDLTNEEAKELRDDMHSWIEDAREAPMSVQFVPKGRARRATATGENRNDPQENADIRAWVAEVGIPNVGDRGRIAADVREAYKANKNMALLEANHRPGAAEDGSAGDDQDAETDDVQGTLEAPEADANGSVPAAQFSSKPEAKAAARKATSTRAKGKV